MVKLKTSIEHGPAVQDVIQCAVCGNTMELVVADYRCSSSNGTGESQCTAAPVNADDLARSVMTRLVTRTITPGTTAQVSGLLIERVKSEIGEIQRELQEPRPGLKLEIADDSSKNFQADSQEYLQISRRVEGINRVLDQLELGQNQINSVASDVNSYLDLSAPEDIRQLVNAFITKLQVRPGEVQVTYAFPLADKRHQATITQDLIAI